MKKTIIATAITTIFMTGCNSGVSGNSVAPATQNQSNEVTKQYVKLPELDIGYGYNPTTNSVKEPGGYNKNFLISDTELAAATIRGIDPSQVKTMVKDQGSDYTDYSKYSGSSDSSSKSQTTKFSGGAAVSYGLYSASVKSGFQKQSDSLNSKLSITKEAGIVIKNTYTLSIDPTLSQDGDIGANIKEETRTALLRASTQLKADIDEIDSQADPFIRRTLVARFYNNYGTHFVSSVTRGYVGVHTVTLTQKKEQSSSSDASSSEAGFSSPFGSANVSKSSANASAFLATGWEFASSTSVFPANTAFKAQLDNIYSGIDSEIKGLPTIIDTTALNAPSLTQAQQDALTAITNSLNTQIKPDPAAFAAYQTQKADRDSMQADISYIESTSALVKTKVIARDQAAVTDQAALNTEIDTLITAMDNKLQLFIPSTGTYAKLTLTSQQRTIINNANVQVTTLKANQSSSAAQIAAAQAAAQKAGADATAQAAKAKGDKKITDFKTYLEASVYQNDPNKGNDDFNTWFGKQSLTQITDYKAKWNDDLQKQGLIDPTIQAQIKSFNAAANSMNKSSRQGLKAADGTEQTAVIDFNIIPWSVVFPELGFQPLDNSTTIIQAKLLQKVSDYTSDMNYLRLCSQVDTTGKTLNEMYTDDNGNKNGVLIQLKAINNAILDALQSGAPNLITYKSIQYDLNDAQQAKALDEIITKIMTSSKTYSSNWYKIVQEMKARHLIQPQGVLLGLNSLTPRSSGPELEILNLKDNLWTLITQPPSITAVNGERKVIIPPSWDKRGIWLPDGSNRVDKRTIGQLLADQTLKNESNTALPTGLPIVTGNSTTDANGFWDLDFLTSNNIVFNRDVGGSKGYYISKIDWKGDNTKYGSQSMRKLSQSGTKNLCNRSTGFYPIGGQDSTSLITYVTCDSPDYTYYNFVVSPLIDQTIYSMTTQLSDGQLISKSPLFKLYYGGSEASTTTIDNLFNN